MLRASHAPGGALAAANATPVRVADITCNKTAFENIDRAADYAMVVFKILRMCVAAEQRAHAPFDSGIDDIPASLAKIEVNFPHVNASFLDLLVTDFPGLVGSLRVLTIVNNEYDESAALGAFATLATRLQELTFERCGLTSMRGLEGRCGYLRKVDLRGCRQLTNIDVLSDRVYLEEVSTAYTAITSIEPLQSCPNLTTVNLNACRQLSSLEPLRSFPHLKKVRLFFCEHLTSIEALEGHNSLEEVDASWTGITSIEPLRTCPVLKKVDLRCCRQLPADLSLPATVTVIR